MIFTLTARYRRNGKRLTVEFSRDPSRGIQWSADLWIETADGPTWEGRITDFNADLDSVVAAAGRYMEDHHPYTE